MLLIVHISDFVSDFINVINLNNDHFMHLVFDNGLLNVPSPCLFDEGRLDENYCLDFLGLLCFQNSQRFWGERSESSLAWFIRVMSFFRGKETHLRGNG